MPKMLYEDFLNTGKDQIENMNIRKLIGEATAYDKKQQLEIK